MHRVGYKQETLRAWQSPGIAWKTLFAVIPATALVAICAHIAIPLRFTPIPITMQTFAVLLLGLLFNPGAAFICLALYVMEGAIGLPVFSPHGPGGMTQLLGPTGGYLLSYPFAAALASFLYRRRPGRFWSAVAAATVAAVVILACGASWLGVLTHATLPVLLTQSITPFLPGEAFKILAAAACVALLGSFADASRNRAL